MSAPSVKLDLFEGPLDLLLHLIKRNEVAVVDIPIATITDQYLAMLDELPELNLDGAGEYLVMAATLTYLKSRTLLPQDAAGEEEGEDDPRGQLVQQLLEYQRYREAAAALAERPLLARDVFAPPGELLPAGEAGAEEGRPVRDASLGDLLDALRAVLKRLKPPPAHAVFEPGISVGECVRRILDRFAGTRRVEFAALFAEDAARTDVIVTFLALLEMIRLKVVRALQEERFGPIDVHLATADLDEAVRIVREGQFEGWRGGEVEDAGGDGGHEST